LLPRHRCHVDEVQRLLGIEAVKDGRLIRSLNGLWQWAKRLVASPHSEPNTGSNLGMS
jgi:hypothetical protein